jgi:AcrR family transcriptional regulator
MRISPPRHFPIGKWGDYGLSDRKVNIVPANARAAFRRRLRPANRKETVLENTEAAGPAPHEDCRSRILTAALEVFSNSGFEGASLRQIADRAGVTHQLVVYHFRTKQALWRAAITLILGDVAERVAAWRARIATDSPAEALRAMVRDFVLFTARWPQFHRIATFEGRADNERIGWLIEVIIRPLFAFSTELIRAAQATGSARSGDPGQLHYAVIGLVTQSFVFAHEYRTLTGLEPFDPVEIEKVADLACDFLGLANERATPA